MKGLIIKDFRLMMGQARLFLNIFIVGILLTFTSENLTFITGYATFICTSFVISTISYDEFDNGNAFLFTLPFQRTTYVKEKYVFGLLTCGCAWMLCTLLTTVYQLVKLPNFEMMEWLLAEIMLMPFLLLTLTLMIPLRLKFDGEKSRVAILGVIGGLVLIGLFFLQVLKTFHINIALILERMSTINITTLIIMMLALTILLTIISEKISEHIIQHKEF